MHDLWLVSVSIISTIPVNFTSAYVLCTSCCKASSLSVGHTVVEFLHGLSHSTCTIIQCLVVLH